MLDLQTLNIYLIIKSLLIYLAVTAQFYNIQFAYRIGDFGKIVMLKYHLKSFYRDRCLYMFSFASDIAKVQNIADEKRSCNDSFFSPAYFMLSMHK